MPGLPEHFTANRNSRVPLQAPAESTSVVQSSTGVGLRFPERKSDCTGARPSWYPFQMNVCDAEFDPADADLTPRQLTTDPTRWRA